ncbi:MAG: aminomethyl-transferring glycine dehydrogenase [Rhodothermia bacterium]|nr:MAG: aminomethyl-transferring glycine dehydrogenase [Rhodothermia bacterium]
MSASHSHTDRFENRHIGPSASQISEMLKILGLNTVDELIDETIPANIRMSGQLDLPDALTEMELLDRLAAHAEANRIFRSYIGMGYYGTITPPAIRRGILENPSWYTQYTPYQAEISQGRLEALLNFQTVIVDLTGLEIANASLLDEGTAAAEAMMMLKRKSRHHGNRFLISSDTHPQTIEVVRTRAEPMGIEIVAQDHTEFVLDDTVFGILVQYPASDGKICDYSVLCEEAHTAGIYVVVAADLLSLTLLRPPAEFGADVAIGSTQRFGVPMGFGGPHAAYFACTDPFKRQIPGRIIGVTRDADGNSALRMALQTREQHIRRDKATSNICTAQVLLAIMAGMYAVYHGPDGLRQIAHRIHLLTRRLAGRLSELGYTIRHSDYFDTIRLETDERAQSIIRKRALGCEINLRYFDDGSIGLSLDQTVTEGDLADLLEVFNVENTSNDDSDRVATESTSDQTGPSDNTLSRTTDFLTHPVFHEHHSEVKLTRYMHRLASRDLSLTTSMIPLGSCTMKLNAAAELIPISWASFSQIHPFVPVDQVSGYRNMIGELEDWLAQITGFAATSLQPNSGASGEYAGLLMIRAYYRDRGDSDRRVCLIPSSAHGTNPASAVMAGMEVVVVACDDQGNIDLNDLKTKVGDHADRLAAIMVTYPSTHGVFEEGIRGICNLVHANGGQVYMDGANMNAQMGYCQPGDVGADVCHLNLHKTFAIPHGGGGPGVGPICVADHLAAYLPGHPLVSVNESPVAIGPVASAPFGSAGVLPISWAYIAMLGAAGLRRSTEIAILNANYMVKKLSAHYEVLYTGTKGRVAHEFILDLRHLRSETSLTEVDVAKRLMDYGFHAPTMSWPVVGTMMVEPTESESKDELDRFCEAMISIRAEIQEVEVGLVAGKDSLLSNAPHTAGMVTANEWEQVYSREQAAFPAPWTRDHKFWPAVRRVDDAAGDRNLVCSCQPIEAYVSSS